LKSLNLELAQMLISTDTTIFWFRRDLRLEDNAGLYQALRQERKVLPLFIFDSVILTKLEDDTDRRVNFIHQSLILLKHQLEEIGSSLVTVYGDPIKIFQQLSPKAVYTNHDYEVYAGKRDAAVKINLEKNGSILKTFKDQVIFEKDEIIKNDGQPYTVFTPYSRKWKVKATSFYYKSYPTKKYFDRLIKISPVTLLSLEEIGFKSIDMKIPERVIKTKIINDYHLKRDFPAVSGTSRLSVHLRFGTVSIRKLARIAHGKNHVWLNELIWREFYQMILWHFPHVEEKAFKPAYDQIKWRNNEAEFHAWCNGKTGYPIVDAGMRELNATGFMHNRVRMITSSFLIKHLLVDWRWGESYFAQKLLDYDLASNNGGWQWAASSGCDAAPYFRIFSPELQTKRFDAKHEYIRKWVPEIDTPEYPQPIVDHRFARERALKAYQKTLQKR
jgi:deoxyribodipyrimidine photo-lyase